MKQLCAEPTGRWDCSVQIIFCTHDSETLDLIRSGSRRAPGTPVEGTRIRGSRRRVQIGEECERGKERQKRETEIRDGEWNARYLLLYLYEII